MKTIEPKLLDPFQLEADLSILYAGTGGAYRRVKAHIEALRLRANKKRVLPKITKR